MPELPEVETIVRYLRPKLVGRKILDLKSDTPRLFRDHKNNPAEVERAVVGRKIEEINRVGKNIIFELSGGKMLLIHLMMTGKLLVNPVRGSRASGPEGTRDFVASATSNGVNPKEKGKHDRMIITLSGGTRLVFNDTRKFGRIRLISGGRISRGRSDLEKLNLGRDPLALKFEDFNELMGSRKGAIKSLLLNQKILAGIGNIYADEILWYAGVKPVRKADSLKETELKKLYKAIQRVLDLAIKKEGTSSRDYRKPDGSRGGYYKIRKAYQRTGEKCAKRDGGTIQRVKIGQRSSHFCRVHQI